MFYSHTFLARKGPLGTVWCAAHLQHKLKKSHYISTNVLSTVERIMFPEVPIALRMSGHLLLGVVRIYSKQVDYFYEDCNEVRITINRVFTSASIDLPDDATHATFQSVTLPEKFDLDTLELDDYCKDWPEDSHFKRPKDITLTEQIPTGNDPYIIISFNEHDLKASSFIEDNSGSAPMPMEEDILTPVELDTTAGFRDLSPSNQLGVDGNVGNSSPQDLPSIEIMRDARIGSDFNIIQILPDRAEPDKFLEEQIIKDKETPTPAKEAVLPDGHFSLSQNHEEQHSPGQLDSPMLFVHRSPEMELQPTPPVAHHQSSEMELQPTPSVAQPKLRRKRRQRFDESTVLSNEHMKNALNDTSGIRRVKKNCPLSSLAIWKQNKRLRVRKEGVLHDPFITGSCADLQRIHNDDFVSSRLHLVTTENTHEGTSVTQSSLPRRDGDMEIEFLRNNERATPDRNMPSFSTVVPSPNEQSYLTPVKSNLGLQSERLATTEGDEILPTADMGASDFGASDMGASDFGASGNFYSEMGTPYTAQHTALSDIPELVASPGELRFLEEFDDSPAGSLGTPDSGILPKDQGTPVPQQFSSRTRAVAQYLKRQSSATPILGKSKESSGDLSLKKILEGKPKKICARMFYETLVLKSFGLVHVHQENAYDDITLKVTPKLSKGQFPC